jgi:hypothetical protein
MVQKNTDPQLQEALNEEGVDGIDSRYRPDYAARINGFERRNEDLRDRVNDYKDDGDMKWEEF